VAGTAPVPPERPLSPGRQATPQEPVPGPAINVIAMGIPPLSDSEADEEPQPAAIGAGKYL